VKIKLLCIAAVSCTTLVAQQASSQQTTQGSQPVTVQGCLTSSNGRYSLTDAAQNHFELQGKGNDLEENAGKQVEITGTPSSSKSENPGGNDSAQPSQVPIHTLVVSSVKTIADSCAAK
jgi:hypothetical protein